MAHRKRIKLNNGDYTEYVLMLAAPVIVSWYYYGANALRLMLAGAVSAVLFELIALTAMKRDRRSMLDLHAVFTGLAVAMMLPATANTALVVAGTAFAIFVVKIPFGSALKTPFVPAAAAMAFLTLCFPGEVFLFPSLETAAAEFEPGVSLAAMLKAGSSYHMNTLRVLSVISGNVAGPMGAGCAVVLLGSCAFFAFIRPQKLCNVAGFVAACAVLALLFPRGPFGRMTSLMTELCAGTLLFSAVFFATDPATSPKKPAQRFIYGAFAGTVCMLLRYFGAFEDASCFGILLANAFWPIINSALRRAGVYRFAKRMAQKRRGRRKEKNAAAVQGGEL